jgi:Tol biopolymer transport system component
MTRVCLDEGQVASGRGWPLPRAAPILGRACTPPPLHASMDSLAQLSTALADRYRIEREIGRGGMATVYLVRDLKHDRQVALKVLDPELGAVLGVERFLSEIKVTANLQHPNLLPLFDSGVADGLLFYVMPYVAGESLRQRLSREKQLPVDEAIHIAICVSGALDYAHRHGVIHRDLKPENILLNDGQPLVADFGIALAVSNAGGQRVTQTGLSLGTPLYMSPEQATGDRIIDGRSDQYSLAAMTYEMLAGDPPHTASTAQAITAKVLTERPASVRNARPAVPEHVAFALQKALEKLPADRWATAAQYAEALQGRTVAGAISATASSGTMPLASTRRWKRIAAMCAATTAVAIAAGTFGWTHPRDGAEPLPVRFELTRLPTTPLGVGSGSPVDVTADGKTLLIKLTVAGRTQLYRRPLNQVAGTPVAGTAGVQLSTTSPDGRWIAFIADGQLRKVPVEGGTPTPIAAAAENTYGISWGAGNVIVLGSSQGRGVQNAGLARLAASGGRAQPFTTPDTARGEMEHRWPKVLPDGKTVLFAIWPRRGGIDSARIGVASLESGKHFALNLSGAFPFGVLFGNALYARPDGPIMAAPVDLLRHTAGEPVVVVDGVSIGMAGGSKAAVSPGGTLIYMTGTLGGRVVLVDMRGAVRASIPQVTLFRAPVFSPDGRRIAVSIGRGPSTIWVYDVVAETFTPLTVGDTIHTNSEPAWTPDGKQIVFTSDRTGKKMIWSQVADASAPARPLTVADSDIFEPMPSRDGRWLVYRKGSPPHSTIWYRSLAGDTSSKPVVSGPFTAKSPSLSPDGRLLAYQSNETGQNQIFVRPFPAPASKWAVSDGVGTEPRWSPDGRAIYYRAPQGMVAAHVSISPTFSVTSREVLFSNGSFAGASHQNYDVSPDGKQFVMIVSSDSAANVTVVANWLTELRARMSAERKP